VPTVVAKRAWVAEALGTGFLLAIVVGSGIMGEKLAGGNTAIALLANALATGAGLAVLILMFGPISGAHFNPVVSISAALSGKMSWSGALAFIVIQIVAALIGVFAAHAMFDLDLIQVSQTARGGPGQIISEFIATFGLVATILACSRHAPQAVAYAVGLYITAGYWFTSSTSFANPAVTIARVFTDTFAGIAPNHAPGFIVAQLAGAVAAVWIFRWMLVSPAQEA
jgi:glycerol uptake facilitator-like aquaporin